MDSDRDLRNLREQRDQIQSTLEQIGDLHFQINQRLEELAAKKNELAAIKQVQFDQEYGINIDTLQEAGSLISQAVSRIDEFISHARRVIDEQENA